MRVALPQTRVVLPQTRVALPQTRVALPQTRVALPQTRVALPRTPDVHDAPPLRAPRHGVGVGLRRRHFATIAETDRRIDALEIVPENFVGFGGSAAEALARCRERWPLVSHGVSMSLGGIDAFDDAFVRGLGRLLDHIGDDGFSEHASFSSYRGVQSLDLLPLPFTADAASHLASRCRALAGALGRSIVLENVTYYAAMPGSVLSEGEFLTRVLDESGASLLLDVNNVYVNARNHGFDPLEVLLALPLGRVARIHLAGHRRSGDVLLDDHGSRIAEPVMALYERAIELIGPVLTIVEWDNRVPALDVLLDEVDRVRSAQSRASRLHALREQPREPSVRPSELAEQPREPTGQPREPRWADPTTRAFT